MQKDSIITQIHERIKEQGHDEVYIVSDFLDLGEYHAVRKALLRLEESGKIKKIIRGVYYYPRYSALIDEYEAPSPSGVAETLARKYNWTIAPCGDTALNQLGLSTQVPAKWSYISDGPYHEFQIGSITIEFKHRSNKEVSKISRQTATIIQALKSIGKEHITDRHLNIIKKHLTADEKVNILNEAKQSSVWIYNIMKKICEREKEQSLCIT